MRISLLLLLAVTAQAAPVDIWPRQPDPKATLAGTKDLPAELQPAVQFQKLFCDILAGKPSTAWRADLENFARSPGDEPVVQGVRETARVWLARVEMQDIDITLRDYYRQHVAFPERLPELPESLRSDPWGQPWTYSLHAPKGFERQTNQRYQLGPMRFPQLTPLRTAIKNRRPPAADWKITSQEIAGNRSLQFKSATANALIQPGGTVDGCLLMFIGDHWALLAGQDQLFTVTY